MFAGQSLGNLFPKPELQATGASPSTQLAPHCRSMPVCCIMVMTYHVVDHVTI